MTTKKSTKRHRLLLAAIPALLLCSCMQEKELTPGPGDRGEALVKFSIQLPTAAASASRALNETTDENEVKEIDILVFEQTGGTFVYNTGCMGDAISGNERTKTFTVMLRQGDLDIVMLANARSSVVGADFSGMNKAAVLALLEASMPVGGKWIADASATGYRPFPMWGDVGDITIDPDTELTGENAIKLTRMIARVDVIVPADVMNFKLTGVDVYNYNTRGAVVPTAAGSWSDGKAVTPNVPAASTLTKGPIRYDNESGRSEIDEANNRCFTEIYLFEAENHAAGAHTTGKALTDRTCLVVSGIWDSDGDGDFTDEGDATYYRVDFSTGKGLSQSFLDVLRNHKYTFSITKVSGHGYGDSRTAFESGPFNIEADVLQWDDADFSDIVFDGHYMLGVRPASEFDFFKTADSQSAEIKTTHPEGWKIVKITEADGTTPNPGWLTTDQPIGTLYGDDGAFKPLKINVSANDTGTDRTGYIYIKAGKLETKLTVTQSTTVPSILVALDGSRNSIDALEFSAAAGVTPEAQTFRVEWAPRTETLYISTSPVPNTEGGTYAPVSWFSYKAESGAINTDSQPNVYITPIDNGSGAVDFTIRPTAIASGDLTTDPFYERQTMVSFRATGGEGTMRKNVILQQYVYNLTATPESFYLADGSTYTFNVKSNRPWRAFLIDDGGGMVATPTENDQTPFASGGYNLPSGTNVEFKTINDLANPTIFSGTAKVRIEWDNGTGTPAIKEIDLFCASGIIQPKSNSYLVKPGGTGILIPVERANDHASGSIGLTDLFSAELVWTDHANRIAPNSNIRLVQSSGTGCDGYVLVLPGSAEGNAVVAVKAGGAVKWSWHIWVTNFELPSAASGALLDRNLGAMSNANNGPGSLGLLYQWGRKDPFPGSSSITTGIEPTIYNASGTTTIAKTNVATANNLNNAVANPATF